MTYRIAIGEKLLIMPITITPPFTYRIYDIQSVAETLVKSGTVSTDYAEIEIDRATFLAYRGKTLLLRLEKTGELDEEQLFLVSGLYDLLPDVNIIKGLLGDRRKETRTGHQEGYLRTASIAIYSDNSLSTLIDTFALDRSYVADFVPDHRFHLNHEKITE